MAGFNGELARRSSAAAPLECAKKFAPKTSHVHNAGISRFRPMPSISKVRGLEALMSSYEPTDSMTSPDAGTDLWRVQLSTGEIRTMTLDLLDEAFQAGTIDEATPVLAPGAESWSTLGEAAGLEAPAAVESPIHSVAPVELDSAATPTPPAFATSDAMKDLDLDSLPPDAFKAKKGRVYAGIAVAAVLVAGIGFAATRLAPVTSSAANAMSAEAALKAAGAAPAQATEDEKAVARLKALTEEQRVKLLEADKAREARAAAAAAKKKEAAATPRGKAGTAKGGSTPFASGGDKYDPLNGAL